MNRHNFRSKHIRNILISTLHYERSANNLPSREKCKQFTQCKTLVYKEVYGGNDDNGHGNYCTVSFYFDSILLLFCRKRDKRLDVLKVLDHLFSNKFQFFSLQEAKIGTIKATDKK